MCGSNFITTTICFSSFFFITTCSINDIQEEKVIVVQTEDILRNVTSKLFTALNFSQSRSKSRQTLVIIDYFRNITLMTQHELNIITILSKVDKRVNTSNIYIDEIIKEVNDTKINSTGISFDKEKDSKEITLYLDISKESGVFYDFAEMDEEIKHILKSNSFENIFFKSVENIEKNYNFDFVNKTWEPLPERRIYKGHKIAPMQFPYLVSIHVYDNFKCAGSIIKSDLIITAASCLHLAWENDVFRNDLSFILVRVGSDHYNKGGELIRVSEINFHPGYNPKNLSNNISILRLRRHMSFDARNLNQISYDTYHEPLQATVVTIAGWGTKGPRHAHAENVPTELSYDELSVYSMRECREIYTSEYVSKKNFCAGYVERGSGACNHDVGGPGVVDGILTGIISFGPQVCGTPDAPTVFTKIGYYSSWIDVIVTQGSAKVSKNAPPGKSILRESNHVNYNFFTDSQIHFTDVPIKTQKTKPQKFTWYEPQKTSPENKKWSMPWLKWITKSTISTWMPPWIPGKTTASWPKRSKKTEKTKPPKTAPWLKWYNYSIKMPTWEQKPIYTKHAQFSYDDREYRTTPKFYYSSKKESSQKFWYSEDENKQETHFTFHYGPYGNAKRELTTEPPQKQNKEVFQDLSAVLKKFMKYIL